jgi:hypothetical protein
MTNHISLDLIDPDGAIRESAESAGLDRAQFLRRGAAAGGAFVAGGVLFSGLASPAQAAIATHNRSVKNDVRIGNYALTLEYLESTFYADALASGVVKDPATLAFAKATAAHEAAHVKALRQLLGRAAVKKPTFDFSGALKDEATFRATAQALEDTGVAAYAGQGPNILQRPVIAAALSIHSVEARHAAWIRFLNGGGAGDAAASAQPAFRSFDVPKAEKQVLKTVKATGFITG